MHTMFIALPFKYYLNKQCTLKLEKKNENENTGLLETILERKDSSNIQGYQVHFLAPASFSLKKCHIFSQKNFFLYFRKWNFLAVRRNFFILFGLNPQNFSLKKFLIFFPKTNCSEKFLIFSQKSFSSFHKTELPCIFFKNVFLIF